MTISVITSGLFHFEIQADSWVSEAIRSGDSSQVQYRTRLHAERNVVAEFTDVHAIWFTGKGSLIKPDDDDEE